jgi:hypothetical protein
MVNIVNAIISLVTDLVVLYVVAMASVIVVNASATQNG